MIKSHPLSHEVEVKLHKILAAIIDGGITFIHRQP
jgi:hypothetical protein